MADENTNIKKGKSIPFKIGIGIGIFLVFLTMFLLLTVNTIPVQDFQSGYSGRTNIVNAMINHDCPLLHDPMFGNKSMGKQGVICSDKLHYGRW